MDSPQMEESTKPEGGLTMTEEIKKAAPRKCLATFLKVVLGLVLLGLGAWAVLGWWEFFLVIIKGCSGLFLLLAGIITLAVAKE